MFFTTALLMGLLMATILSLLVLVTLAQNPRIWLASERSAPKAIREAVPPMTDAEKRLRMLWGIPVFAITFLMPLGTAFWYEATVQPLSYFEAVGFLFIMWMCFSLMDLIIIDWLIVVYWQPAWSTIPEVKHLIREHAGYLFHLKAHLRGAIMIAVMSLLFAGIIVLF